MTMGEIANPSWCQDCQDAEESLSTELRNFLLCAKHNTKPSILMLPSYKRQVTSSDGRFDFHWFQTMWIQSYFLLLEMVIRFVHWVFLWEQSANPKSTLEFRALWIWKAIVFKNTASDYVWFDIDKYTLATCPIYSFLSIQRSNLF